MENRRKVFWETLYKIPEGLSLRAQSEIREDLQVIADHVGGVTIRGVIFQDGEDKPVKLKLLATMAKKKHRRHLKRLVVEYLCAHGYEPIQGASE